MQPETYFSANKGIKLYVNDVQKEFLDRCMEGYVMVYNWALNLEIEQYLMYQNDESNHKYLTFIDLSKMYVEYRKSIPLLAKLPYHSLSNAVKDVFDAIKIAIDNFAYNFPTFKTYGSTLYNSFRPRNDRFYFNDNLIKIEGLKQPILTSFHSGLTPFDKIKFINPVIHRNNRTQEYTLTYVIEKPKLTNYFIENQIQISEPIGVDVNKRIMFACSNGLNIPFVDTTRIENHINQINSQVEKDRNRYIEQQKIDPEAKVSNSSLMRLNKRKELYEHLANIHKDVAYKGSLEIIKLRPEVIILEDLNLAGIMSDSYMKRQLQHHPLGIAQRILAEQCFKYGIPVVYAPRAFQSSNYCSNCGTYQNIKSNKVFICPICGMSMNRDTNAAINLRNWYIGSKLSPTVQ